MPSTKQYHPASRISRPARQIASARNTLQHADHHVPYDTFITIHNITITANCAIHDYHQGPPTKRPTRLCPSPLPTPMPTTNANNEVHRLHHHPRPFSTPTPTLTANATADTTANAGVNTSCFRQRRRLPPILMPTTSTNAKSHRCYQGRGPQSPSMLVSYYYFN